MEKPRNPVAEDLKEIAWAVFLFDLILLGAGVAVWLGADLPAALWLFGGAAALLTLFVAVLVLANVLLLRASDWWRARREP